MEYAVAVVPLLPYIFLHKDLKCLLMKNCLRRFIRYVLLTVVQCSVLCSCMCEMAQHKRFTWTVWYYLLPKICCQISHLGWYGG